MYERYATINTWDIDTIDFSEGKTSGIKYVTFSVTGPGAFGRLRYESGIHRVQRFSETASTDVMHTSAATVVVLPEMQLSEVKIKANEIREDTFATGGPGGQSQNKSCSGVRLTHLSTGIVASIRENKSQLRNRERAWQVLLARVSDYYQQKVEADVDQKRRQLRGRGSRCEKIRTYNYPQDRITDHRINVSYHSLDKVLDGHIDNIVKDLINYEQSGE
jgi:peptide chain release factor 1